MEKTLVKTTDQSRAEFTRTTLPTDMNEGGSIYGAHLLEWADNLSAIVAIRHRRGWVTTASFDSFNFVEPIHLGDFVLAEAFISGVGDHSMEIFVKFLKEDSKTGNRFLAAYGFITYAALKMKEGERLAEIKAVTEEEQKIMDGYKERKTRLDKVRKENQEMIKNLKI